MRTTLAVCVVVCGGAGETVRVACETGNECWTYAGDSLRAVAMPLGGIGAGQIALCGDSSLRQWQIFNNVNHIAYVPHSFFAIYVEDAQSKESVSRVLQSDALYNDAGFTPAPTVSDHVVPDEAKVLLKTLPGVKETAFTGTYPVATMIYSDPALPVQLKLEALSPMVPLDEKDSGLPLIRFKFTVTNSGTTPVKVRLAATLQNAVGWDGMTSITGVTHSRYGGNVNEPVRADQFTAINMANPSIPKNSGTSGTMTLATTAQSAATIAGWDDLNAFWRVFNASKLPSGSRRTQPSEKGRTWNGALIVPVSLEPGQSRDVTFFLSWYFPNRYVSWQQRWLPLLGVKPTRDQLWLGNFYNTMFKNSLDVVYFALKNDPIFETTRTFAEALYAGSLPQVILDRVGSQTSIIRSPTCMWVENGKVFAFEGCNFAKLKGMNPGGGCCPLNCTHVWNYEQSLAALYPVLERTMRDTDLKVQMHESGYIPHRTVVPLSLPRPWEIAIGGPGKPALDGMLGTVLKTYREYLRNTQREWLDDMYPYVKRLLQYVMTEFDPDHDGVITGEQPNTYDIYVYGANTFIGSLWLAALRAGEQMARIEGENAIADSYHQRFEKGRAGYDQTCWNGEYYVQVYDSEKYKQFQWGTGCHSDQLLGQWWAHILGLGYVLPEAHVKQAVESIYKYNFREVIGDVKAGVRVFACGNESGLLNCTWPRGGRPQNPILYCDEVWTGIEYEVASLMIFEGTTDEAVRIVKAVHDRYDGTKRNPYNEIECGDHYARAMASWSVLEAAVGYRFNGTKKTLEFAPRLNPDKFESFFVGPAGWGTIAQRRSGKSQEDELNVRFGKFELNEITLVLPSSSVKPHEVNVKVSGETIPCEVSQYGKKVLIAFSRIPEIGQGDTLSVTMQW